MNFYSKPNKKAEMNLFPGSSEVFFQRAFATTHVGTGNPVKNQQKVGLRLLGIGEKRLQPSKWGEKNAGGP